MAEENRDQAEAAAAGEEAGTRPEVEAVSDEAAADAAPADEASAAEPAAGEAPADEAPEPSELDRLRRELEEAREEARKNHDLYLREAAETENTRKRVTKEKQDAIRYANETLVRDLLPVIDDLERAARHAPADGTPQPLLDGIEMVLKGCFEALRKHGVTQITAKGQPFDPEKHEAYAQVETAEHEANTVVDEIHRGYCLADRLLRPSLVSVARPPAPKEADGTTVESEPAGD